MSAPEGNADTYRPHWNSDSLRKSARELIGETFILTFCDVAIRLFASQGGCQKAFQIDPAFLIQINNGELNRV